MGVEEILKFLNENWLLLTFIFVSYGWLLRVGWKIDDLCEDHNENKVIYDKKIEELKTDYKNDLSDLKSDLKENVRLLQNLNLSLTSLSSYLHGIGFTLPEIKGKNKEDA